MAKAVTTTTGKENLPAVADDFSMFDGIPTGHENVTSSDLLIPRLTILQGLSPQVTQGKSEFDPNAKVGEIYDAGMGDRFPDGVLFVPVSYVKQWLEWAPRNTGKGLIEVHHTDEILNDCQPNERKQMTLPNGNYIVETASFFGINLTAGGRKCFLPMTSTQLKKARRLLTLSTSEKLTRADGSVFTPPIFYRVYNLTTVPESNAEGSWMGWKIERAMSLPELPNYQAIFADAKLFAEQIADGAAKGDLSGADGSSEGNAPVDNNAAM